MLRERVPSLVGVLARGPKGEAKAVWGRDFLIETANGLDFRVSGEGFWQVNAEIAPFLAQSALELAQVEQGERALDLFCGAGFFALHLARAGAEVVGIEFSRGAIRDAIWNTKNAAHSPWTCFRKRRTSKPWRCFAAINSSQNTISIFHSRTANKGGVAGHDL
jgi:tRNA/tmRNA/rRNA uracil-C5-methylase (TrmA/RlmC/RlmD family)